MKCAKCGRDVTGLITTTNSKGETVCGRCVINEYNTRHPDRYRKPVYGHHHCGLSEDQYEDGDALYDLRRDV